jgi:hypothetical protein
MAPPMRLSTPSICLVMLTTVGSLGLPQFRRLKDTFQLCFEEVGHAAEGSDGKRFALHLSGALEAKITFY